MTVTPHSTTTTTKTMGDLRSTTMGPTLPTTAAPPAPRVEPRRLLRRRRRRPRQSGATYSLSAALALLLASSAASGAESAFAGATARRRAPVAAARPRADRRSEIRDGGGGGGDGDGTKNNKGERSALRSTTAVAEPRPEVSRRSPRPPPPARTTAGIKRRTSICGSESRAHRDGFGSSLLPYDVPTYGTTLTRRRYVKEDGGGSGGAPARSSAAAAAGQGRAERVASSPAPPPMPPWLPQPDDPPPSAAEIRRSLSDLRRRMYDLSALSDGEVHAVVHAIETASRGCPSRMAGAIDYCGILVETMEMGRDALVAAAFHYCGCVEARVAMGGADGGGTMERHVVAGMVTPHHLVGHLGKGGGVGEFDAAYLCPLAGSGVENYGAAAVRIALDAARLKGTEAVAAAVSAANSSTDSGGRGMRASRDDADNLRGLLLGANARGDWRGLALRCAACLYRLRGLQRHRAQHKIRRRHPTADEIRVGREALHIYAPLSHRLGMHKLKSELEGAAFQALYHRQHEAVTSLLHCPPDGQRRVNARGVPLPPESPLYFADHVSPCYLNSMASDDKAQEESIGYGMRSVLADVTSRVKRMLHEDDDLMAEVETVEVSARIKEPYSLWRKMLKIHLHDSESRSRPLSVLDVPDAMALRVVVSARKLTPDEDESSTSLREERLCYHVRTLCSAHLGPPARPSKDYIRDPKPNGYMSLHYSGRTRWHGEDWPFEVQVRSADMHRVAEFGLAAHWEYKARWAAAAGGGGRKAAPAQYVDRYLEAAEAWRMRTRGGGGHNGASSFSSSSSALLEDRSPLGPDAVSVQDNLLLSTVAEWDPRDLDHTVRAGRVRARAERLAPYLEALESARSSLARERVFVFVNGGGSHGGGGDGSGGGRISSLPSGARVLDALREEERRTGVELRLTDEDRRSSGARGGQGRRGGGGGGDSRLSVLLNGSLTSMTQRLENGDVLTFFVSQRGESEP